MHDFFNNFVDIGEKWYWSVVTKIQVTTFFFENWGYFWNFEYVYVNTCLKRKIHYIGKRFGNTKLYEMKNISRYTGGSKGLIGVKIIYIIYNFYFICRSKY